MVEDPDAPGGTFLHWVLAGIPPEREAPDGEVPSGAVEGRNDFGEVGWGPPCPPPEDPEHRYVFTIVAVDEALALERGFRAEELRGLLDEHAIARGELVGRYGR